MSDRLFRRLVPAAILGASLLLIGCASTGGGRAAPSRVDVLHPDATSRLEVEVGEVVAFDLPGHAGTGYVWRASGECPTCLQFIDGPTFTPDDANRVGSSGLSRFRYRVIASGEATIAFEYVRSWETDARPVRRSVVEIVASGG
jgi:predicted secreted protein